MQTKIENHEYNKRCEYCTFRFEHTIDQHKASIHAWVKPDYARYSSLMANVAQRNDFE
jgi:hypothetical protein